MTLRVRAKTGSARRSRQVVLAGVVEVDESEQSETGSVANERSADVPVKVAADLARMDPELLCERTETELGLAFQELQCASREHVRCVPVTRSSTSPEPMRTLPKLGDEL